MVAKIKSGKSLIGALNYNERKVSAGKARLVDVSGYCKDTADLTFGEKLYRLSDLAKRNQRVQTNTVHISLNFDPSEKLSAGTLRDIAEMYMRGIGFAEQPYLIYEHLDSGHPHIHIVSTNIDPDGKRISLHNLGKTKSETTRKRVEQEFNLVAAGSNKQAQSVPNIFSQVEYGVTDSKKAIETTLSQVIRLYKFTSLPELNAVLSKFNLQADQGNKDSIMFKHQGLRYWITDKNGNRLGVPIKSSMLFGKPTLRLLKQRFTLNEALRRPSKELLAVKLAGALNGSSTFHDFQKRLASLKITTVVRKNETGRMYGITFVDHDLKVVFKGSDVSKNFSAAALSEKYPVAAQSQQLAKPDDVGYTPLGKSLLELLIEPENLPLQDQAFAGQKRKKKKRTLKL